MFCCGNDTACGEPQACQCHSLFRRVEVLGERNETQRASLRTFRERADSAEEALRTLREYATTNINRRWDSLSATEVLRIIDSALEPLKSSGHRGHPG
jgi:hypothetical protein